MEVHMSIQLPSRPNLEHLKAQAKDLLSAFSNGQEEDRVLAVFAGKTSITLSDAQLVVAREYGFESWPKLKAHVELYNADATRQERANSIATQLVTNEIAAAMTLLLEEPDLAHLTMAAACVTGSVDTVRGFVEADREAIAEKVAPNNGEPLLYVCFSRLLLRDEFKGGMLETAKLLLDYGADPRAFWLAGTTEETCLYGAAGVNGCPELVEMLLRAGADPNADDETLYHASEVDDLDCMRLLLANGGKIGKATNAFARVLDFERPALLNVVLENTPDKSELPQIIPHALRRGRSTEMLRILIESGVDLNRKAVGGLTPYQAATRMGRRDVLEMLEAKGAVTTLSDADRLVGRIANGEAVPPEDVSPEAIRQLDTERSPQLAIWAANGNDRAVETLLSLGANVNATDENGWTALFEAGLRGGIETVRILLRYGANTVMRDKVHNGHAIGFACAGSLYHKSAPPETYVQIIELLLEHGGELPTVPWGSPEVQELLVSKGVNPA
jgi:ankyrin repeat protein